MAAFLADTWIVDAIIALVAVEGVVLVLWRVRTGGGLPIAETLANLSSGAALLLALRVAITPASSTLVLALLPVALIAHVADLASRWESAPVRFPNEHASATSLPDSFGIIPRIGSTRRKMWRARVVEDGYPGGSRSSSTIQ